MVLEVFLGEGWGFRKMVGEVRFFVGIRVIEIKWRFSCFSIGLVFFLF